ncbi:MAG TPA: 2TM domain-containing protein, partial [Saprospiraceae bacterium]|nr:2TM domain-containing protein [Saprospiraceae bacterium]
RTSDNINDEQDVDKRLRKIKKFYKDLASWAGLSVFLIALNLFLSGDISWAKYPVFFWGIAIAMQFFNVMLLQKLDRAWEEKLRRKLSEEPMQTKLPETEKTPDYSEELLKNETVREKEVADLSEYRKLSKPWKDEDLV